MKSLLEIEVEIRRRGALVGAPEYLLPTYGRTADFGRPHIESDGRGYHYVVVERGEELRRETTADLDELLYFVFEGVTFSLACDYECAHPVRGRDVRRLIFARQIELLASLSPGWAEREARDHERILAEHPFRDA